METLGINQERRREKLNITGPKVIFTIPVLGGIPISGNGGELLDCHGNSGDREHAPYKEPSEGAEGGAGPGGKGC